MTSSHSTGSQLARGSSGLLRAWQAGRSRGHMCSIRHYPQPWVSELRGLLLTLVMHPANKGCFHLTRAQTWLVDYKAASMNWCASAAGTQRGCFPLTWPSQQLLGSCMPEVSLTGAGTGVRNYRPNEAEGFPFSILFSEPLGCTARSTIAFSNHRSQLSNSCHKKICSLCKSHSGTHHPWPEAEAHAACLRPLHRVADVVCSLLDFPLHHNLASSFSAAMQG